MSRAHVVLDLLAELVGDRPRIAAEEPVGHVPDEVHLLHEGPIHLAGSPRAFVESADPVVRQFIDGRADGPLPVW